MRKILTLFLSLALLLSAPVANTEMAVAGSLLLPEPSAVELAEDTAFTFAQLANIEFLFSSGVGAWFTYLTIAEDGSFTGEFHDTDMGDSAEAYPFGTVYGSTFHGQFELKEQVNEYTYVLKMRSLEHDEGAVPEAIEDGVRYITSYPYGLDGADEFLLYLPGAPVNELPEEFLSWVYLGLMDGDYEELPFYGLYNVAEEAGFFGEANVDETGIIGSAENHDMILVAPLEPEIDAASIGSEDCTVSAGLISDNVQDGKISFDVFSDDMYSAAQVLALRSGDALEAFGEFLIVETMTEDDYGIQINGGYFDGDGVTFCYVDGDPDTLWLIMENDAVYHHYVGTVTLPLAETITFTSYAMDEEGNQSDTMTGQSIPADQLHDFLAELEANYLMFYQPHATSVRVENGFVVEIMQNYVP